VADKTSGIAAIDITQATPGDPAYADPGQWIFDVATVGTTAYAAAGNLFDGAGNLYVLDYTSPASPNLLGNVSLGGPAWGVSCAGDWAFLAADAAGMAVIDLTDLGGGPQFLQTNGFANDVQIQGKYAFVANGYAGVAMAEIVDPTTPGTPVHMDTPGEAVSLTVEDGTCYVATGESGLVLFGYADPLSPVSETKIVTPWISGSVAGLHDSWLLVGHQHGLHVIDITTPTSPTVIAEVELDGSGCQAIEIAGNRAFLACGSAGVGILDLAGALTSESVSYIGTSAWASDVAVRGPYLFIAEAGLSIMDISNTEEPVEIAHVATPVSVGHVEVADQCVVMGGVAATLVLIDVTEPEDPGEPVEVTVSGLTDDIFDLDVTGAYAYVTTNEPSVGIVDVSNPANPSPAVYVADGVYRARGLDVVGTYAYVSDVGDTLYIIDVSDPTNPGTPVQFGSEWGAMDVKIRDRFAYVVDNSDGFEVIKLTD